MSFRNRNLPARSDHESEYIAVLNEILITPQWWLGLRDEAIVSKWKANSRAKTSQAKLASMLSHSKKVPAYYLDRENEQLTHTAEFLIQELQYIAKHQLIPQRIYTTNNEPRRHHPELQEAIKSVFEIMVPMFELAFGSLETEPLSREIKKDFQAPQDFKFRTYSLSGRTVQVIVKMASVHLTPEKPAFNGGRWHLEGMENEYIVATGILYYATENITSSRLTFRNKTEVLQYFSGYEEETQVCGQIEALQNRCVVFPNNLQHKVEDFELEDKSRPGHRKMLAFFLIHPDHKIFSTADVGIQQVDWLAEELYESCGFGKKLPLEVVRQIALFTGAVMTEKEARDVAYQVADERKYDGSFTMKRPRRVRRLD